ncbi:MAG: PEP-CTERM sorting domain-containing protein [Phycisphaeraceae bacterium]
MSITKHLIAAGALLSLAPLAMAGTFKTITIDGDYSDWADVPVLDSDAADNVGSVDIADIQIANDNDFLYIRYTHHTAQSLGTFIALDVDSNVGTGFDVFGLGLIGSEAGWQNDFPFTQGTANFNNGFGMSGDFFGSGAALLDDFSDGSSSELAISLDITFNEDGSPVFADDTFTILLWTDLLNGDVNAPVTYTLAVPEPASAAMALVGLAAVAGRRR